jgi:uncharacterized protein YbaR (Trm112 family)
MISQDLLKILCCPETHQKLEVAEPALLASLNEQVASAKLLNRAGQPVQEQLEGGLVRADRKFLYPIRQNIPIMLIDEAIPLPG